MKEFLIEIYSSSYFNYLILPILIFLAKIFEVSIGTLRIIFVAKNNKLLSGITGFFEALIWLIVIAKIFENISNIYSYIAYATGFAVGVVVGVFVEEKLAMGTILIRIITRKEANELIDYLKESNYRITYFRAKSNKNENTNIIYLIANRTDINFLIKKIKELNPNAFYTVEDIKFVSEKLTKNHSFMNTILKNNLLKFYKKK